ncbi:hypothetical protein EX30DRAFT_344422 [Ascodesmis nigricans]|uniref:Senescence domain-containing protein n=1 Tax=Ascodesmis nigricans TaxID=341454 RepID=A0A4S2MR32_9PEZI|nr:hypothetical protein EX30DRAFT_344422 [Ascodesmis nigricans]
MSQHQENILFSFPGVTLSLVDNTPETGYLTLSSYPQPTDFDPSRFDIFLRLQHSSVDVLVEAWRELQKTSPSTFTLSSNFGDVHIGFPELGDALTGEALQAVGGLEGLTWESVVAEFESEIDRFVSYRKNQWSLIDGPGGVVADGEKGAMGKAVNVGYNPGAFGDEKKAHGLGIETSSAAGSSSGWARNDGRLVLVDEENGNEVGEVGGMNVQSEGIKPGSKDPVDVYMPTNGNGPVVVRPADYLKDAVSPEYANSRMVQTAASASRLIVTTSAYISNALLSSSERFQARTKPNPQPMTFQPSTHTRVQQFHNFTGQAAKLSSATLGRVSHFAQNAGAKLAGKDKPRTRDPNKPYNPNIFNKSLIAFNTVADSIDYASKSLLGASSAAATTVIGHKYGPEAGAMAESVTGGFKNVGLVYIDAAGVSRRAVVKGVAKGMVVGRVKGGGEVMVPVNGSQERIDGIPPGWGDGPLGGPNAGPPPPGYTAASGGDYGNTGNPWENQGGGSGRNTPQPQLSDVPPAPMGYGSVSGEYAGGVAYGEQPPPPEKGAWQ